MRRAFLTPNIADLTASNVGRFYFVPGNLLAYFTGAVQELTISHNWEQFGTATVDDTVQTFMNILDNPATSPIGSIMYAPQTNLPDYLLPCDGTTYLIDDYKTLVETVPELLTINATTFSMPDFRGKFILTASSAYPNLSAGGSHTHELTIGEMPEHEHSYVPPVANIDLEAPGVPDILAAGVGSVTQTGTAGNGDPHNNMPEYISLKLVMWAK